MKVTKSKLQEMVKTTLAKEIKNLTLREKEEHLGFDKLKNKLAHKKGIKDPGAVAAAIGNKKYGKVAMQKAAHSGHSLEEAANVLYEKHIGFRNLVNQLKGKGMSDDKARATAYSIGVKKYGKEKMTKAAAEHKPLSDKDALKEHEQEMSITDKAFAPPPGFAKVDTRKPMNAKLVDRIKNLALYDLSDEEILDMLGDEVDGAMVTPRWVQFVANMVRKGKLEETMNESPPEGWHGTVAAMKQHHHTGKGPGKIDNPYALAHWMKNQGEHPHYKEQPSSKHGKPVKK